MRTKLRSRPCSRRPSPVGRSWAVGLLVALFLGTTTIDLGHRAAVDHAVCDDHGELVHLAPGTASIASVALDAESRDEGPQAVPRERQAPAHEHCQLGPFLRERACKPRDCTGAMRPAPPPRELGGPPCIVAALRTEPLLLLAPKQSPPV